MSLAFIKPAPVSRSSSTTTWTSIASASPFFSPHPLIPPSSASASSPHPAQHSCAKSQVKLLQCLPSASSAIRTATSRMNQLIARTQRFVTIRLWADLGCRGSNSVLNLRVKAERDKIFYDAADMAVLRMALCWRYLNWRRCRGLFRKCKEKPGSVVAEGWRNGSQC